MSNKLSHKKQLFLRIIHSLRHTNIIAKLQYTIFIIL